MATDFSYDPRKDAANRRKHGVSLIVGREVIRNMIHEEVDSTSADEERWICFGYAGGLPMVCVYAIRGVYRIISVRRATKREERRWLRNR